MEEWARYRHQTVSQHRAKPPYVASLIHVSSLNGANNAEMISVISGAEFRTSIGVATIEVEKSCPYMEVKPEK